MTYPQLDLAQADMIIQFFDKEAPVTVANFVGLAQGTIENKAKGKGQPYYDGIIFHRVIKDFMIQGGDPSGTGMGGESIYGESFEDEFSRELYNLKGALSMANAGPNTNGSQFFIVTASNVPSTMLGQMQELGFPEEIVAAYATEGGTPWLDQRHTVFGHVVEGMDVVIAINKVVTGLQDKPVEPVVIETIDVLE